MVIVAMNSHWSVTVSIILIYLAIELMDTKYYKKAQEEKIVKIIGEIMKEKKLWEFVSIADIKLSTKENLLYTLFGIVNK